jgi:hypothetical protein
MIEDFTPARTTLSSGVVVKQNLLERNRQAPPSMSFTMPEYTGTVKSFARDYNVHYAEERPGNALINAQIITASSVTNTTNWPNGAPTGSQSFITASGGSGTGATFRPIVDTNQVTSVVVEQTGSGYASGDVLLFTSQSISSSLASSVTEGGPSEVANNVEVTLGVNDIAPILSPNSDFPQQNFASGSSVYRFSGGTGGVFEPFNTIYNAPISNSREEFYYNYNHFTSSTSILSVISASKGTFAFNSTDGALATKIFIKSLSDGNAPTSSYSPNLYDNLLVLSKSMVDKPGIQGGNLNFNQINQVNDNVSNPLQVQYNLQYSDYRINSVIDYFSPPLVSGSILTVTRQSQQPPLQSGVSVSPTLITTTQTSGRGSGVVISVETFGLGEVYIAASVDTIGEKYEPGDTITIEASTLQAAGFSTDFDSNLVMQLKPSDFADTNVKNGVWEIGVTATGQSFSPTGYVASTFTESFDGGYTSSFLAELFINEGPFSGLTAAQVSASQFAKQYPGVVQVMSESLHTELGVGFPMGSSYTQSLSNVNGQGVYNYPRIDQREFYNGEFPNSINVGIKEICKAFFGQESRIDYFFQIQWINDNIITEENFLTSSLAFQPAPGNVWFWADTVSFPKSGSILTSVDSLPFPPANPFVTTSVEGTFDFENFTYTGPGAEGEGGIIRVRSAENSDGTTNNIVTAAFVYSSFNLEENNLFNGIATNTTNATNATYTDVAPSSTSGTGINSKFTIVCAGGSIQSITATTQGKKYKGGDTITFAAGTFGASSTEAIINITADNLTSGVTKKYNAAPNGGSRIISITQANLINGGFSGASGDLSILLPNSSLDPRPSNKVKYIKMSDEDMNGEDVLAFIQDSDYVIFTLTGAADYLNNLIPQGFETYYISNASIQIPDEQYPNQPINESVLLFINQPPSTDAVTSFDTLAYDFTFSASGQFVYYATSSGEDPNVTHEIGFTESVAQGYFPRSASQNEYPGSGWTTESFFRGWATATWADIDITGGLVEVGYGSGFLHDPLQNFNTGSKETNNDQENPYLPSVYPWFMNATQGFSNAGQTFKILDNSSLVGGNANTDLQLYTGSITASSELIYPGFTIYTTPSPIQGIGAIVNTNTAPLPPTIDVDFPSNALNLQNGGGTVTYNVTCTDQTCVYHVQPFYLEVFNNGWIALDSPQIFTGDQTITFTISSGDLSGITLSRDADIIFTNMTNPIQNQLSRTITQQYKDSTYSYGGEGSE